ncbi:MAG: hypothetical protein ACREJ2_17410 [Planctomycetota bacterium]
MSVTKRTQWAAASAAAGIAGASAPVIPEEAWQAPTFLSGVAFLRSLTAMILDAGWGCKVTTGRLFELAKNPDLEPDRQATVRSALWLTLVSHPRAVLEFAAADGSRRARTTLKLAVQENHEQSGLTLQFLEKIAATPTADGAEPGSVQAVAAELLAPSQVSSRRFAIVAA